MSYIGVSSPSVSEVIKASWGQTVAGDTSDLNTRLSLVEAVGIPNGTFEYDDDSDGIPDNWTRSVLNVTLVLDTTDRAHGTKSIYFQFGAAAGTGTLTSDNYTPCAYGQRIESRWYTKGSQAALPASVTIHWYADDLSFLSSTTLWDVTTVPTSWTQKTAQSVAPSGAYYYRIELKAGDGSNGVANETVHYDGMSTRVYHGAVPAGRTSKGTINSDTTTTIDLSAQIGDDGAAHFAQVELVHSFFDGARTFSVSGWVNGAWATISTVIGQTSAGSAVLLVPLNDSNQFRVVTTGGGADSVTVYLAGIYWV